MGDLVQAVRDALDAPCGRHRGESLRECPECLPERIADGLDRLSDGDRGAMLAALRGTP
jgi:hypothetical protein